MESTSPSSYFSAATAVGALSEAEERPPAAGRITPQAAPFVFQTFVVEADAAPSRPPANEPKVFRCTLGCIGWQRFAKRSDLESLCAANGVVTIVCGILLRPDKDAVTIPASNMTRHLEHMLDCADGSDVSFLVGGETFRAHRAVLAARSPVFKAELFGSMEEANMPCITLHDIEPAVFKILLRYMYTDRLPPATVDGDDLHESTELFRHILAAADRYGLDRLKLGCAQRLFEGLSVDTVAATLGCAEMYSCPELKKRCLHRLLHGGEELQESSGNGGLFPANAAFSLRLSTRLKSRSKLNQDIDRAPPLSLPYTSRRYSVVASSSCGLD